MAWGRKKWLASTLDGDELFIGDKRGVEREAAKFADKRGGDVWIEEADDREPSAGAGAGGKRQNPPRDGGRWAYEKTGLPAICEALYGQDHLTADLVEEVGVLEALRVLRPWLPPGAKYNPRWSNLPSGAPSPDETQFAMLGRNAKLSKGDSALGRKALCFGLSLTPHQVGLRGFGSPSPQGFVLDPRIDTPAGKDELFTGRESATPAPAEYSGVAMPKRWGRGRRPPRMDKLTLCARATGGDTGCRAACLVHSGQNPASDEALVSKLALTAALYAHPREFCRWLLAVLRRFFVLGDCHEADYLIRLNVLSDLPWEQFFPDLIDPYLQLAGRDYDRKGKRYSDWRTRPVRAEPWFYDYTKIPFRMQEFGRVLATKHNVSVSEAEEAARGTYHLTFSYSGTKASGAEAERVLRRGDNVAVVFVLEEGHWQGDEFVSEGAPTIKSVSRYFDSVFGSYDLPAREASALKRALEFEGDPGAKVTPSTRLGRWARDNGVRIPVGAGRKRRRAFVLEVARKITGDPSITAEDVTLPVTPSKEAHIRGRFGSEFLYPFKFMGYPVINGDRNDLRAYDPLSFKGPHIVGLDFKVPKIKTKEERWEVLKKSSSAKREKVVGTYDTIEAAHAKAAEIPGARVKQKGVLTTTKIDLDDSVFINAVRETPEGHLVVAQTPNQTPTGRRGMETT